VDPDTWRGIARCGGAPEWTLTMPGATWFDACSLSDAQEAEIIDWAVGEGLAERIPSGARGDSMTRRTTGPT
jgi:hypothetical protein